MKKYIICLFVIGFGINTQAQKVDYEEDLGAWYMLFVDAKVTDKFGLHAEAQQRYHKIIDNKQQLLVRTSLDYFVNAKVKVSVGYGNITSTSYFSSEIPGDFPPYVVRVIGSNSSIEHRIYQQLVLKQKYGRFNFAHRYRLEQRWVEGNFSSRARYFMVLNIPINNKEMEDKTLFYSFYDEIFLNISENPFSQNRFFHAIGYKMNGFATFKIGYLYNFTGVNYNRLQFGVWLKPDFRRKITNPPKMD